MPPKVIMAGFRLEPRTRYSAWRPWRTLRGMRFVLLALAVVACHRNAPAPTTPANKAPAPSYTATAEDELGFLSADADIVFGLNMAELRRSQLWHAFEPQLAAFAQQVSSYGSGSGCGDMTKTVERVSGAIKILGKNKFRGVFVVRSPDIMRALECSVAEAKQKGGTVTVDRGVTITTNPTVPGLIYATIPVGTSTLVVQMDEAANHDSLMAVLESGAPLRKSPAFMMLFGRREPRATLWGMANGNAGMFDSMASTGFHMRSIDGTIVASDKLVAALRMTMASPDEAARIASELDKVKGPASAMLERFESHTEGPMVVVDVAITEDQIRALVGMLGLASRP